MVKGWLNLNLINSCDYGYKKPKFTAFRKWDPSSFI